MADGISSLFPYLLSFYLFLQDWGIKSYSEKERVYDYDTAFNN
jgi:hypothetical protein